MQTTLSLRLILVALCAVVCAGCGNGNKSSPASGGAAGGGTGGSGGIDGGTGGSSAGGSAGAGGAVDGGGGWTLGPHEQWPPSGRNPGVTVCQCVQQGNCPDPGPGTLPTNKTWYVTLRQCFSTFTESDFTLQKNGQMPQLGTDPSLSGLFPSDDQTYRLWLLANGAVGDTKGLQVAAKYFVLKNIEGTPNEVHMSCGYVGRGWIDGDSTAWWAEWNSPANPYYASLAVQLRAMVACGVDLIMRDQATDAGRWVRSDMLGASLAEHAYVYHSVKHLLPPKVQQAFETGLRAEFSAFENLTPAGTGGGDMEMAQLVGLYELGQAIPDPALATRIAARVKKVIDYQYQHKYFHMHGGWYDASYEGIALHVLGWAASASGDQNELTAINDSSELKAYSALPDPDGNFFGPTNFSTATADDAAHDQWGGYARDSMLAMLSPNARYLIWTRPDAGQTETPGGKLPSPQQMQDDVIRAFKSLNNKLSTPDTSIPGNWDNVEGFAPLAMEAAYSYYRPGFYAYLKKLESEGSDLMKPPFERSGDFIQHFGNLFTIVKLGGYGAIIHTGGVASTWANGVSGKSGGSLSAFWTPGTGSVVLGRSRGTQGSAPDEWTGARGWDSWAVNAISGENAGGAPFSSARWRIPTVTTTDSAPDHTVVTVDGEIGQDDSGYSAPNNAITGKVNYKRVFDVQKSGLTITTTLTSDGTDKVSQLWEMIPVFLRSTVQASEPDATIDLMIGGSWTAATTSVQSDVTAVRIQRFGHDAYIVFKTPRSIKLSSDLYIGDYQGDHSRVQNLMIDLLGGSSTMPTSTSVQYTLTTAAP